MQFSLASLQLSADYFPSYLYTVRLDGFSSEVNIQTAGGSVGSVIPAQHVEEDLFSIAFENLSIGPGIVLPIPQAVSFCGKVSITFYDSGKTGNLLVIEKQLTKWVNDIHTDQGFIDLSQIEKTLTISKYSSESDGYVVQSVYGVFPPSDLKFSASNEVHLLQNSCTFQIVRIQKMDEA